MYYIHVYVCIYIYIYIYICQPSTAWCRSRSRRRARFEVAFASRHALASPQAAAWKEQTENGQALNRFPKVKHQRKRPYPLFHHFRQRASASSPGSDRSTQPSSQLAPSCSVSRGSRPLCIICIYIYIYA